MRQLVHSGAQPEIFQGRGGFVKLGHFDKHFVKNSRKIDPAEKVSEFFSLDTQNYIVNSKFNLRIDTVMAFFSKIRVLFMIFKKKQGRFPSTS